MKLRQTRREDEPAVNLTPLIDVVFILLIFFMVSTTFDKQTQLKVELPSATTTDTREKPVEKIEITIDAKGDFYVNERELVKHDAETLRRSMQKIAEGRSDLPVIVSGDRNAPLQSMMTVLDVAAQLDLVHLSFVARQTDADAE